MRLKFQQIFNKFPTVEKCDFDRQFLLHSYLLNFSSNFTITVHDNQKLKARSFQLRKNYFCMLNIECPIARQSSITFFFIHPVYYGKDMKWPKYFKSITPSCQCIQDAYILWTLMSFLDLYTFFATLLHYILNCIGNNFTFIVYFLLQLTFSSYLVLYLTLPL